MNSTQMGEALQVGHLAGTVENIAWSPDGRHLLLHVAEPGADNGGALGGARHPQESKTDPSSPWLPTIESSKEVKGWRRPWIYDRETQHMRHVEGAGHNFWEVHWLGINRLLAIISQKPDESAWYSASLAMVNLQNDSHHVVYQPRHQIGVPSAAPSATWFAVIEALCSDREGVAGDVLLFNAEGNCEGPLDLRGVDVTQIFWHSEHLLCYTGLRGSSTVAGSYDTETRTTTEYWNSHRACGPLLPQVTMTAHNAFAIVEESWNEPQRIILAQPNQTTVLKSFEHEGTRWLATQIGQLEEVTWPSKDGLEIQGYLGRPRKQQAPGPLILNVHGGPVYTFRNKWQLGSPIVALLVSMGYSVLSPNPRGSMGKGQAFSQKVLGDLGGADAQDLLTGVEAMLRRGVADHNRIGVMGVSYGGYMATWLPTQSDIFAASMAIAPVTNWHSNHNLANIGAFDTLFLGESPYVPGGLYHGRSPVNYAGTYSTPIMQIVGANDRCVPPSQALEYHNALSQKDILCELVTYPHEGHGIRDNTAYMDLCTRAVSWFDTHLRS